jgi:hypothetical protein
VEQVSLDTQRDVRLRVAKALADGDDIDTATFSLSITELTK